MKIAVLHYHLQPGGVQKIIEAQIKMLNQTSDFSPILISGFIPNKEKYNCAIFEHPVFNYLPHDIDRFEAKRKYDEMKDYLLSFIDSETILHCHNLNLGKNPILTKVVSDLAYDGFPVVNHCHDFAEDNRPKIWQFLIHILEDFFNGNSQNILYPNLHNYTFVTINSKDTKLISKNKIPPSHINFVSNPVSDIQTLHYAGNIYQDLNIDEKPYFLYPVRAIERKNIGEMILLSALYPAFHWIVTLSPKNPIEQPQYQAWKNFTEQNNLPVLFDAGEKTSFAGLYKNAYKILTVSKKEGFGMTFLEPWLNKKEVVGRNLSEITIDFTSKNVNLQSLYDQFNIPISAFKKRIQDQSLDQTVDFSTISLTKQANVIENVLKDTLIAEKIRKMNNLDSIFLTQTSEATVTQNASIIKNEFSLEKFGGKLVRIYREFNS